jgi:hypothetical protein
VPEFDIFGSDEHPTAGDDITESPELPNLTAAWELTERTSTLSERVETLQTESDELRSDVVMREWQMMSSDLVRRDMPSLLGALADLGFAWRDVARMIGVSVPAIQKWRRGGTPTGESRFNAAAALAACVLIIEHYRVKDVAGWFQAPILMGYPITALDLYSARKVPLVFELASGYADPERVLSDYDSAWREKYKSEFEVFLSDDGPALRQREI